MTNNPTPGSVCRDCAGTYAQHDKAGDDWHRFRPLLTGQRPPAWMSLEERREFEAFTVTGSPVQYRPGPRGGPRTFELAERETIVPPAVRDAITAEATRETLVERLARKLDSEVLAHLEEASEADLWRIVTEAGTDWLDRTMTLARQLRATRAQRDQAERTAERRGEHLDRLEAAIRAFSYEWSGWPAPAAGVRVEPCDGYGRTTTTELLERVTQQRDKFERRLHELEDAVTSPAREAVQCDAAIEQVDGLQGARCEFYAGHDQPHRAGGWTWR